MPEQLRYAQPVPWHRRRWIVPGTIVLSALVAVVLGSFSFRFAWKRWEARNALEARRQQDLLTWERCNQYTAPPSEIAWEEDPVRAAELVMDRSKYSLHGSSAARQPPVQQARIFARAHLAKHYEARATLFFHGRTSAAKDGWASERQLVIVELISTRAAYVAPYNQWSFRVTSILPAWTGDLGVRESRVTVNVPAPLADPANRVRFYTGQPDGQDPSHFTIGYAINDAPGIINGWLGHSSIVELKVRDGPATQPAK